MLSKRVLALTALIRQRWNNNADDPNRNFVAGSPCDECNALRDMLSKLKAQGASFSLHIDLHETTNSDEEEFMPAKAARDGAKYEQGYIPDGFYLVGDSENPEPEWHAAIIGSVKKVTHIAPPDVKGEIIGEKPTQEGERTRQAEPHGVCGRAAVQVTGWHRVQAALYILSKSSGSARL